MARDSGLTSNEIHMVQPAGTRLAQTPLFVPASAGHGRDTRVMHEKKPPIKKDARRCLYCGQVASLVWVHGHGQCTACGINVDECCRGESCGSG